MMLLGLNQFLFQFPIKCRTVGRFFTILMLFPVFLLAAGDGRGIQESWDSARAFSPLLNSSSIIQQREQQDQRSQQAAFQAYDHHKTGQVYNVSSSKGLPLVQALRLRTGSFRKRGVLLNEFMIVPGCHVQASLRRVLLVYENLGKSDLFPVEGYELVGPVVGVFAYDASNLSTTDALPKLGVVTTKGNITVRIPLFQPSVDARPFCAYFETDNLEVAMRNLTPSGVCETTHLGYVSLIAKSLSHVPVTAPTPSPSALTFPPLSPSPHEITITSGKSSSKTWKVVVGSVAGAVALTTLLSVFAFVAVTYRKKQRLAVMERHADYGETLHTSLIGNTRAPAAGFTRTQPTLESDYIA